MENPQDLIRRASMRRRGPRSAGPKDEALPEQPPVQEALPPKPVSCHASYTALMRSHDRMGTRHIPRQS